MISEQIAEPSRFGLGSFNVRLFLPSRQDIVLNAVALAFVLDVDDLLAYVLLTEKPPGQHRVWSGGGSGGSGGSGIAAGVKATGVMS